MMKKLQLIGFTLMAVMFLASCGGGNNDTIKTEREDAEKTAKEVERICCIILRATPIVSCKSK